MLKILQYKPNDKWSVYAPLILRVVTGIIFAVHGYQKLSWGIGQVGGFLDSLNIPLPLFFAYLITYLELLGGIALILGIFTFWVPALLAVDMLVAILVAHRPNGFYVADGGYEFALLLLAATVALALTGSGAWAVGEKIKSSA